jgi:hypothetical protein
MAEGTIVITISNQVAAPVGDFTNAKRVYTYRGYTATALRNRSSSPAITDINPGATYIDCKNITTTKVETALGVSNNSVEDLCKHTNVNKWSGFSPYTRSVTGALLIHNLPTNCQLGDFAGYNHNAATPHFIGTTHSADISVNTGATVHFTAEIHLGELPFTGGDIVGHSDCVSLVLAIYDGATIEAYDIVSLATATDTVTLEPLMSASTVDKAYTCKVYLSNNLVTFTDANIVCGITELANYVKRVYIV